MHYLTIQHITAHFSVDQHRITQQGTVYMFVCSTIHFVQLFFYSLSIFFSVLFMSASHVRHMARAIDIFTCQGKILSVSVCMYVCVCMYVRVVRVYTYANVRMQYLIICKR